MVNMDDENNNEKGEVKTYISSLNSTEKELKSLLNTIMTINGLEESLKFKIVGNKYVKSVLNDMELNSGSGDYNHFENKNGDEFDNLDTDSFTKENVDFFISIIGNQIEDSNYPETNLKKDFNKVYTDFYEEMYGSRLSFYISHIEPSSHDDLNEVKKSKLLKKDMDSKVFTRDYSSLDEFEESSQNELGALLMAKRCIDEGIDVYQNNEEFIIDILESMGFDIEDKDSLMKKIKNDKDIFSLLLEGDIDEFLTEFIGKIEEDSSFFEDAFEYVCETKVELLSLNDLMGEENKVMLDDPSSYFEKNSNKVPKLYNKYAKIFNEISNGYEEDKEENRKFRTKAIDTLFYLVKIGLYDDEMLLSNTVNEKKHFEDVCKFVEYYLSAFIETTTDFPPGNDAYGKSVKRLLKEDNRILDNIKSIKAEMEDLKKKYVDDVPG